MAMSSQAPLLFLIVGRNEPLYSAEFGKPPGTPATAHTISRQSYIVMHSALDLVDKSAWLNGNMYLKVVDQVNHQMVSTFLTACHVKFMLLHTGKSEDTIRNFFNEIYELYTKASTRSWKCIIVWFLPFKNCYNWSSSLTFSLFFVNYLHMNIVAEYESFL